MKTKREVIPRYLHPEVTADISTREYNCQDVKEPIHTLSCTRRPYLWQEINSIQIVAKNEEKT